MVTLPPATPPKFRRYLLPGLAVLALFGLLVFPATGWIVYKQFQLQLSPVHIFDERSPSDSRLAELTARHPDDFAIQFAATLIREVKYSLDPSEMSEGIAALETLAERFPDNPVVPATILRYLRFPGLNRPEDYLIGGQTPPEPKQDAPISLEQLAVYDRYAAIGERLAPDNAYFSFMRACGLYAAHRDTEAREAVLRAGRKPVWDDYALEESAARCKLEEEAQGALGAMNRTAIMAAILFPHYARMRQTTRIAIYQAIQAEERGDREMGLALRRAIMRYGALMRVQGRTLIANLVGVAITAIGTSRPGGGPVAKRAANDRRTAEQRMTERQERYMAYLRAIGQPQEAEWARADLPRAGA